MTPEEKFNQEVWWILQEIKKEQLATARDRPVDFHLKVSDKAPALTPVHSLPRLDQCLEFGFWELGFV